MNSTTVTETLSKISHDNHVSLRVYLKVFKSKDIQYSDES